MLRLKKLRLVDLVVVTLILVLHGSNGDKQNEIFGCGGFVISPYALDLNQIQIKLFTKQGNLKQQTESAPTTGYYFMPFETKGQYIMRISPPEGWTFEPSEYSINFDGVSHPDACTDGIDSVDINFTFKGFSIFGKIQTLGHTEGPADALLTLSGPDGLFLKARSKTGGFFSFGSIPPGKFTIRSSHAGATYEKDTVEFEMKENFNIENSISISGYEIKGRVTSDKSGVEGVTLVLLGDTGVTNVQNCQTGKLDGFILPETGPKRVICHQMSDSTGTYRFKNVIPGKYAVIPIYKSTNIVYNVSPERLDVTLNHHSVELPGFEVAGFTIVGVVKGPTVATVLINGEVRATSDQTGKFSIPKMKPGTYEFQINAEKFQFDPQSIKVTASNPILPDFHPAKFELCGKINLVRESKAKLFLKFESLDKKVIQRESVGSNSEGLVCYFLPAGKYVTTVESDEEKFFVPTSVTVEVPSPKLLGFTFKEFSGHISGRVQCPLLAGNCEAKILLWSKTAPDTVFEEKTKSGIFQFNDLASGHYTLKVTGTNYCFKDTEISTILRDKDVKGIDFIQTGFAISIISTHATKLKISTTKTPVLEQISLGQNSIKELCLKEYSAEGYEFQMESCHTFESNPYKIKLDQVSPTKVQLRTVAHQVTGTILTNAPLTTLEVKKDGKILDSKLISLNEQKDNYYSYELKLKAAPSESISLTFFSYDFIFTPNSVDLVGGDDCATEVFEVKGQKSQVIKGTLSPPLEGVEVQVELQGHPEGQVTVRTNKEGEYIAGPFIHSEGFRVIPKMPGYFFKPIGDGYSFQALQWAKIQIRVEEILNRLPVSPVLLSLSGPNGYRQNRVTDVNGEMTFGDLHPGTYFLKALLKEFSFEPSAIHIELAEEETKEVKLSAKREAFSVFGKVSSLSGEVMSNLMVTANGLGNCSEYGEEGVSDENGYFRIWSLKSYCKYKVVVVKKDEYAGRVERTIPEETELTIGTENIQNLTFVIIQPVKRMDVSLRVRSKNVRNLESLRALIYSSKSTDSPLFSTPFNGVPYIILPPIPKDGGNYYIVFESTLSRSNFDYELPEQINFTAKDSYAHFSFDFTVTPIHHEQDLGKSSYLAFSFVILVFLVIINFGRISGYLKELIDKYLQSASVAAASKRKLKTKSQ